MDKLAHILVVDDDPEICDLIKAYLTEEGFRVSLAANGVEMRGVLAESPVGLVILDVALPGEDGLTLAANLCRQGGTGVIMLSRKDDLVDKVAGLEVGADDYLAKPFHLRELLARIRSVLRRNDHRSTSAPWAADPALRLRFAGWELDRDARQLRSLGGELTELSAGEFDLLLAFLNYPKRPLSRDQLLDLAHDREAEPFDRSIDVQVGRLRRKIEVNPRHPEVIKTVRGVGYVLGVDVERC